MVSCHRGAVVVLLLGVLAVPAVALEHDVEDADGIEGVEDLGEVDNQIEVEAPSGMHMYHQAYLADADDVSEDGIEEWTPVAVDASLYAPDSVWDLQLGGEPQLFRDSAEIDLSEFDPSVYYIFLWGCGTDGTAGGQYIPGDCEWIDPYRVEIAGMDAEFRVMYQGEEYHYEDQEWTREGDDVDLVVEDGDYTEILDTHHSDVDVVTFDQTTGQTSTVDDLEQTYNIGAESVIWHADQTGDLGLEDAEGDVAPVEVRSRCSGGQSWNGDECTDMFNLVAVPLDYPQSEFRTFFHLAEDDVQHWAEERSPLRHDYDDPRQQVKLNLLEPEDEYEPTDGTYSGETMSLSDVHTDACWAPGPVESCTTPGSCVYMGQYDLSQVTERAVQQSPFSDRYDKAMGVFHGGDLTVWDPSELVSGSPESYGTVGGCANTLSDRFVYSDDFGSAVSRQRTMTHELGHALDLCHTLGADDGETCDLSAEPDPALHPYRHGVTCKNDQSITGTYSIMNYCRNNEEDRYWGDPDVGGPDDEEAPYTIVQTWMQHYIEGEDPPDPGLVERGLDTRDRIIDTGEDIEDEITDTPGRIRDGAERTWDTITDTPGNIRDGAESAGETVCDNTGWVPGC